MNWPVGRERALRLNRSLWRKNPEDLNAARRIARLLRAVGRPASSLRFAADVAARYRSARSRLLRAQRVELLKEAALSAHLLGRYTAAHQYAEMCLREDVGHWLGDAEDLRLLIAAWRLLSDKGSAIEVGTEAKNVLTKARRHPLAAAALALVASHAGGRVAQREWSEKCREWTRSSLGHPFCHDNWQQAQAILRQVPTGTAENSPQKKRERGGEE